MKLLRWAFIAVVFATAAGAEPVDRTTFYLRDVRTTIQRLDGTLMAGDEVLAAVPLPDPDNYKIRLEPSRSASLSRSFTRSVTDLTAAPLGVAFKEDDTTQAGLTLGGNTSLSFSASNTQRTTLAGALLDRTQSRVMGLTQSIGGGESASSLKFTRTSTSAQTGALRAINTTTDNIEFASGLVKDWDLNLKAGRFSSNQGITGTTGSSFASALTLPFSGGATTWGFSTSQSEGNGHSTRTEKFDLAMPLKLRYGAAMAELHRTFTDADALHTEVRDARVQSPFPFLFGKVGSFEHRIYGEDKGAGLAETTTTRFVAPLRLGGKELGLEETLISLQQGNVVTRTETGKLTAPLAGGQAVIQQQTVRTVSGASESEQRQLAVTLPQLKLDRRLAITAQHIATDTSSGASSDVTNLGVRATPLSPLTVEARYVFNDAGEAQPALMTAAVQGTWALSKTTQLVNQYNETEAAGAAATTLNVIELVRNPGASGLAVRAGLATYSTPSLAYDDARRLEVSMGDPKRVALSAAYSEYDPGSKVSFQDNALVALSLQHGSADRMALRWRYEDQPTRVQPAHGVDVALPALGGTLQLSYFNNPLAPDGRTVRVADQYEAALARKLFGGLSLQVGYRYLDYNEVANVDQNLKFQLDGGSEGGGGKLALSYLSGDYCPANPSLPTGSVFDVSYARTWGDNGRLSMTVQHRTPPANVLRDDTVEGRLEYKYSFW